jgi:hypothetical protein
MTLFRERTTNSNDSATLTSVALNTTTSTKIVDACSNGCKIFVAVSNNSEANVWLKLQAASVDNDKKGIFLPSGCYWESVPDNIYVGEISAIADDVSGTINITYF